MSDDRAASWDSELDDSGRIYTALCINSRGVKPPFLLPKWCFDRRCKVHQLTKLVGCLFSTIRVVTAVIIL